MELVIEHARDGIGLGDLLRLETLAFEHVEEIGVAAEVELVGPIEADAAIHEQPRHHAVADRRADLALDVVTDDRQAFLGEAALPVGLATDEHRDGVDEPDAGTKCLFCVPLRGFLAADRKVRHHHVDLALAEDADDVGRLSWRFLDDLAQVLAQAVVDHPALDGDPRSPVLWNTNVLLGLV